MKERPSKVERLGHILEAIERIFRFVENMDYEEFSGDEMAQFAVIKNFEIIGEAAYHIPKEFRLKHEEIEWRKIIAFRHILVHDYYKINTKIVWNSIENKLLELKKAIEKLLKSN